MIKWLLQKYRKHKLKSHITKESCFVFPIMDKSELIDGKSYESFDFRKEHWYRDDYRYKFDTKHGTWNSEKDCFIVYSHLESYEEFKPLRYDYELNKPINHDILEYNPCDINALDLQEIRNITFTADDNTQDDDIWERLIKYFEDRGLSE